MGAEAEAQAERATKGMAKKVSSRQGKREDEGKPCGAADGVVVEPMLREVEEQPKK